MAPAGYVIRLAGAGDIAADWETVELPSSDGGFTVERKSRTMADYTGPPNEDEDDDNNNEKTEGEGEAEVADAQEVHVAETTDAGNDDDDDDTATDAPLRLVLGENAFADRFRESESLRASFAAYSESIYFFFSALDDTLPGAEHSAAWALID